MENLSDISSSQSSTPAQQFSIQKLYIKHLMFDISNAPSLFKKNEQPKIEFQLAIKSTGLEEKNHYEVMLDITAHAVVDEKNIFDITVKQCGIFLLEGYTPEQLDQLLNNYCPSILFPYAREAISETAVRGGLLPLLLAPINFDALYTQKKQKEQEQQNAASSTSSLLKGSETIQ
jgi:preprotein translocase subunit SecB